MDLIDLRSGAVIPITDSIKKDKKAVEVNAGSKEWYDNSKLQLVRQQYPNSRVKEYFEKKIYQTSVIPALFLKPFEGEQDIQSKNYNFVPIVSTDHHPDPMELSSVVEQISAPVKKYNLQENTAMTYVMRQTHASWIMNDKMYRTHGKYFISNQIGGILRKPEGAVEGKDYERVQPPATITGIERMSENSKEEWKILSGMRDSVQSARETTGESGKLAAIRIQQSNLMLEPIAKNAQFAYLMISKNNIEYMKRYMTDPRTIRIVKDDNDPQWLQLNMPILGEIQNDLSKIDFDLKISISPFGKQAKEVQEQKTMNMANFVVQSFGPQYVPLETVIKDSTMESKGEWLTHIEQAKKQEAQLQQQQQQAIQQESADKQKEQDYLDKERT